MSAEYDPAHQAFATAIQYFKANLKDDALYREILNTTSIQQVYDLTDKLQAEQAKKGHLSYLSKIQPFLQRLNDYAGVIEVFLQAKPEVLALIWGPIKLIIQWASALKQSFDAIINTMADIGILLPEFQLVGNLFSQSRHINDVMVLFFRDILDFYLIALNFFSLPRWRYVFEAVWLNHRDKIKLVMNHIDRHALLMRNEVRLEHIQAEHGARQRALEHFERTERANHQQEYNSIKADISPKAYGDILDRLHSRVCGGTGKWLMRDSTFIKWLDARDMSTKLLWLQGIPGAGKTYLASIVVYEARCHGRTIYAFLSYATSNSTSVLSILHSLIFQVSSDDETLRSILCQSSSENLKSSIEGATVLLTTLLNGAGPVYVIVDGIDEIGDGIERGKLLKQLTEISKSCEETKILVGSRIEADISRILQDDASIIRVDHYNAGSIQTFVNQQTQQWFVERNFTLEAREQIQGLLSPLAANAKGMFLYAKVILGNIEDLEVSEIYRELQVLPENLDDAYKRILSRVNSLNPPTLRDKARKLLGWIGCTQVPLTIQEIEQALIIRADDLEGNARVLASLNIVKICGPIIEVVDGYVQLVHFTVKEYFFSPRIDGFIDIADATLSLALCCITYLTQRHNDPILSREAIIDNILLGKYRLRDFAALTWIDLVLRYLEHTQLSAIPEELATSLELLLLERTNEEYNGIPSKLELPGFAILESSSAGLRGALSQASQFRKACVNSDYNLLKKIEWVNLDPLTTSGMTVRTYHLLEELLCVSQDKHNEECFCNIVDRNYGEKPFKCSYVGCSFKRVGFETKRLRDSHMKHHNRPWKCSFPGCKFAEGGFLSRKMRDDHLDRFHQDKGALGFAGFGHMDIDEVQPLLFDLIKLDKVEAVRNFLPQFEQLPHSTQEEMQKIASFSGSASMLDLIGQFDPHALLRSSVQGRNLETFKYLLPKFIIKRDGRKDIVSSKSIGSHLNDLLKTDSEDMYEIFVEYVEEDVRIGLNWNTAYLPHYAEYIRARIIQATEELLHREEFLLRVWKILKLSEVRRLRLHIGDALVNIASTTCSIKLATYWISCGADPNHRRAAAYLTPLHYAARKTTREAAEFMKFLLLNGADPELTYGKKEKRKLGDEKGPQNIAHWLCMSWDSLVLSVKEEREKTK